MQQAAELGGKVGWGTCDVRCRDSDLWIETQQPTEAEESMPLLNIIPNVAQGSTPGPYKMTQVWGNALRADPGNSAQGDGAASNNQIFNQLNTVYRPRYRKC